MTPEERERFAAIFADHPTLALASEREGQPYVASVFFTEAFEEDGSVSLYCSILEGSHKLANLRGNGRVGFAVSPSLPTRWVQGLAEAEVLEDESAIRDALDRVVAKSPEASDFLSRLPVRAVRLRVRHMKLTDITGPAPYMASVDFTAAS